MKKILIAHDLETLVMSTLRFLHRSDIEVFTADSNEEILRLHVENTMDLIITRPDLPGLSCDTLFHIIRRSAVMKAVSILLACKNSPGRQKNGHPDSVNAIVNIPVDPVSLAKKVQELLEVPPRRSYRVVLNMTVEGKRNNLPLLCHSENVSTHGMLVRTEESLVPGDRITCSFYLPDGKRVSATGEVARVVPQAAPSDPRHYGIRFVSLTDEAEAALSAFVEKEVRKRLASDPLKAALVA